MARSPRSARSNSLVGSVPGGDPDEEASLQLILMIGRSFKHVDDLVRPRMAKLGLSMTEFSVLATLYNRGPTPLGELSDRILLTGASTTYTVKKLEKRRLMTRQPAEQDHRVVLGAITDTGRRLLERIFPIHKKDLVSAMKGISVDEKNSISALLKKMQAVSHET